MLPELWSEKAEQEEDSANIKVNVLMLFDPSFHFDCQLHGMKHLHRIISPRNPTLLA